jgi:trehalose 6-phosphate synthase
MTRTSVSLPQARILGAMTSRPILVVSNRGPVSFRRDDAGSLTAVRGAGGLVSGLSPLMAGADRTWLAAALSDDDRAAIAERSDDAAPSRIEVEAGGVKAILAAIDPDDLQRSYDVVCNATLWYVHHHLFALAREPVFDPGWWEAWQAYRRVNAAFADLVAEVAPEGAAVLVQDYHLCLLGPLVAERRPDLRTVHFSHTPFAAPDLFDVLPESVRVELLTGLAGHGACGFHTSRWQRDFLACCERNGVSPPTTFASSLGPDAADLLATRDGEAFAEAAAALDAQVGDRRVVARVDRIELSKNLVRGFVAFDVLLERHPEWRERVTFAASVYPSREANPDYVAYRTDVAATVERVNARWGTDDWTPILLNESDHFPTSVATLARADVVLVNPVRDGLNLVAKESMLVNGRDALLALSPEAGAWDEMAGAASAVHPFDVVQTADALHELLGADETERARRANELRKAAGARTPADWLADQLAAAG